MALKQHSAETSSAQTAVPKRPGAQMMSTQTAAPNVVYRS